MGGCNVSSAAHSFHIIPPTALILFFQEPMQLAFYIAWIQIIRSLSYVFDSVNHSYNKFFIEGDAFMCSLNLSPH